MQTVWLNERYLFMKGGSQLYTAPVDIYFHNMQKQKENTII